MHRVIVSLCLLSVSLAGSVFGQEAETPQPKPSESSGSGPDSGSVTYDSYSGGATVGTGGYLGDRKSTRLNSSHG